MPVEYRRDPNLALDELLSLYQLVGWTEYTKDPEKLIAAVSSSLSVVTAHGNGELVGLARVVGDGLTIVYLQDILVAPEQQRRGIGRELFQRVMEPFADVRQKVLMTDDEPRQTAFYESLGFTEIRNLKHPIRVYARFD